MCGRKVTRPLITPPRLTPRIQSQSSKLASSIGPNTLIPALLTRIWSLPISRSTVSRSVARGRRARRAGGRPAVDLAAIAESELHALCGQRLGDAEAEAADGAGDQGRLAGER